MLDSFLEDESLFGEFLRAPVSGGGVEPLVVGPPHVVVEVMPQLLDRGVVVPVRELGTRAPSSAACSSTRPRRCCRVCPCVTAIF